MKNEILLLLKNNKHLCRQMFEEVKAILDKVQHKVDRYQKLANQHPYGNINFEHYDREYAKATAQYNILLEVFK